MRDRISAAAVVVRLLYNPDKPLDDSIISSYYKKLLRISNNAQYYYSTRMLPKKSGGFRTLEVPYDPLKTLQQDINRLFLQELAVHDCAMAYRKGTGIAQNAAFHAGAACVVKLDLADFFGSISVFAVRDCFMQNGYDKPAATLLANLCCLYGHLPQGASTSPAISNACFYNADCAIAELCAPLGVTYTRYCDDLTFSGNFEPYKLIKQVKDILSGFGFKLNAKKTSVKKQGQRQSVTGITVNGIVRVDKPYRRAIRQEMYYIDKFGVRTHLLNTNNTQYIINGKCRNKKYLRSLLGKISYCLYVDCADAEMQRYKNTVLTMLNTDSYK